MDKRMIRALKMRYATSQDVEQGIRSSEKALLAHAQMHGFDLLAISLYPANELRDGWRMPFYVIYLTQNDYITLAFTENTGKYRWLTGRLEGMVYVGHISFLDNDSLSTFQSFFGSDRHGFTPLVHHQQRIVDERLQARHKRIMDCIDQQMALVPDWPSDFDEFMNNTVLPNRYVFYQYCKRKYKQGVCTNCHSEVAVEKPRHNQSGTCPSCGATVIFKSKGYYKRDATNKFLYGIGETSWVCVPQRMVNGFVLRYAEIHRLESPSGKRSISIREAWRVTFSGSTTAMYKFGRFRNTGIIRWCDDQKPSYCYDRDHRYPANIGELAVGTAWQYCTSELFHDKGRAWWKSAPSLHAYLLAYMKQPCLEYIVKAGLQNIANAIVYDKLKVDVTSSRLHEILSVKRSSLPLLIAMDADSDTLNIVQALDEINVQPSQALLSELRHLYGNNVMKVIRYAMPYATLYRLNRYRMPLDNTLLGMWLDYLRMGSDLGYDFHKKHVLMPKQLKESHDTTTYLHRILMADAYAEDFKAVAPSLKKYEWQNDGGSYRVVAPTSAREVVDEGHALNHCVHSYIRDVVKGTSAILFLRRTEQVDKPFVTIEIRNKHMQQCRAKHNKDPDEKALSFLKLYEEQLQAVTA